MQNPVLGAVQSTLCFTPGRPVHSKSNQTSLGSIQPHCNSCTKTFHSHVHHCLARYSFIQLSELKPRGVNNCLSFSMAARGLFCAFPGFIQSIQPLYHAKLVLNIPQTSCSIYQCSMSEPLPFFPKKFNFKKPHTYNLDNYHTCLNNELY